ncbi:HD domain-containing protein [Catenuloplanes atrovinosus]|uniref:HD domain-containing protein n=1 Tax=Catenuloplanes atrovinosus TaxID=137266 RepID=A0AAE3YL94_9ACTN|nr:HD domain-containing protein [Catenuloplanes atrovinosus]MDR7275555.1 hypothetical protein [Catenuloplanes atrovinosus]
MNEIGEVAGVRIPRTELARRTIAYARETMPELLVNHVLRTYVFGAIQLGRAGTAFDEEVAFAACVLHDLGLLRAFWTPAERFEVDGADAARAFLDGNGVAAETADLVWDAIALHTSFGIALRKRPEIAIVALGSGLDFAGVGLDALPDGALDEIVSAYPRRGFKKDALDTMIAICAEKPAGVMMHYFAEVGRRHVPGFALPTVDEVLMAAPFHD